MKLTSNTIKNIARDLFKGKKQRTTPRLIQPRRDWLIGVFIGVGILIGIMAWSAYMYVTNRSGEQISGAEAFATVPVYRAAVVEEALDIFAERQTQFENSQASVVTLPAEVTPPVSPATSTPATTTPVTNEVSSNEEEPVTTPEESEEPPIVTPELGQ